MSNLARFTNINKGGKNTTQSDIASATNETLVGLSKKVM